MRAYATDRRGAISNLTLRELPKPSPAPHQLLIRVRAAALNPADLKILFSAAAANFLHHPAFPMLLGYDFSGVVAEVGAAATGHAVGDEVYGFLPYTRKNRSGTFAEFVCVDAAEVGPKPKSISHEEAAAAATAALTALQGLRDKGRLAPGQAVLINGASGGVGSYAVQMAKLLGGAVSALCSAGKADAVRALGADTVYDYKTTHLAARKGEPGALDGRFDIVFDVASNASFGACAHLLAPRGAYVTLLPSPSLFVGKAQALFSQRSCDFVVVLSLAANLAQVSRWFDEGKLKPVLERTYPFAELPAALERMKSGEVRGKLALTVAAE